MDPADIVRWIAVLASLSALASGGALYYARVKRIENLRETRFNNVVAAFGRTAQAAQIRRRRQEPLTNAVLSWAFNKIGYKRDEPYMYMTKWWVVCLAAAPPARLICWVLAGLLDDLALWLFPVVWWVLVRSVFKWMEQRYVDKLLVQFPDALGMIVRAVRVGIPVNVAIQSVALESRPESAREFTRAAEQLSLGTSVEDAVAAMARHSRLTEYRFFATALSLQSQTGGGLTETLENLADVIRKRVAMRARGNALSGEAKTSAGILACLPVFTTGALLVLTPSYANVLFNDPGGRRLLTVAVFMLCGGILVMRTMIKKALT
jgi:tight adherence protein B